MQPLRSGEDPPPAVLYPGGAGRSWRRSYITWSGPPRRRRDPEGPVQQDLAGLCQMKDIRALCAGARRWRSRTTWSCLRSRAISSGWRPCAPCSGRCATPVPLRHALPRSGAGAGHPGPGQDPQPRASTSPDNATPRLREIRPAKKQMEEQLSMPRPMPRRATCAPEAARLCAEEDSEEMQVRRCMGAGAGSAGRRPAGGRRHRRPAGLHHPEGAVRRALRRRAAGADGDGTGADGHDQPELCDLLEQEQGRASCRCPSGWSRGPPSSPAPTWAVSPWP